MTYDACLSFSDIDAKRTEGIGVIMSDVCVGEGGGAWISED